MLQRIVDATLRNLSTLALVCAVVLAPLHFIYGLVNRDAITVREMAPAIEAFPEDRQVRSVGRAELDRQRLSMWFLIGLELLVAIPLLLRPTRRVLEADRRDEVPSALAALRKGDTGPGAKPDLPLVVVGAVIGLTVIVLAEIAVAVVVPMLEDSSEWVGVAVGQTVARSLGLPFLLTALVLGGRPPADERPLDLY